MLKRAIHSIWNPFRGGGGRVSLKPSHVGNLYKQKQKYIFITVEYRRGQYLQCGTVKNESFTAEKNNNIFNSADFTQKLKTMYILRCF
jgi:hypothetical protein